MHATSLIAPAYQHLLKPVLFQLDPELVHDAFTSVGSTLGSVSAMRKATEWLFAYSHDALKSNHWGIETANPVGLSAGFDYNGKLSQIAGSVGFGFISQGTVTNHPYEGNTKPRLGRLPKSKALLVNKGFKSIGIDRFLDQSQAAIGTQKGISIGATNSADCATASAQIADIVESVTKVLAHPKKDQFAYLELNISCPNVRGSGHLADPKSLTTLLKEVAQLKVGMPIFVKFPIKTTWEEAQPLIKIMITYGVSAVIIGNLLKDRKSPTINQDEIQTVAHLKGNISGKPTTHYANELIAQSYQAFGQDIGIIGVGGVFSAVDAYEKIKLGASRVQLITGMIYQGPQVIGQINHGLVELLKQDGYTHIDEAIGAYYR